MQFTCKSWTICPQSGLITDYNLLLPSSNNDTHIGLDTALYQVPYLIIIFSFPWLHTTCISFVFSYYNIKIHYYGIREACTVLLIWNVIKIRTHKVRKKLHVDGMLTKV